MAADGEAWESADGEAAIEPLGAPTDPLRPTGRVRGGERPAQMPWPSGTRRLLVGFIVAAAVLILLAVVMGSVLPQLW